MRPSNAQHSLFRARGSPRKASIAASSSLARLEHPIVSCALHHLGPIASRRIQISAKQRLSVSLTLAQRTLAPSDAWPA